MQLKNPMAGDHLLLLSLGHLFGLHRDVLDTSKLSSSEPFCSYQGNNENPTLVIRFSNLISLEHVSINPSPHEYFITSAMC